MLNINKKYKTFFEYRYLINECLQKYSQDKYDKEQLYDAAIAGLFKAIDEAQDNKLSIDFKSFALFHIKSSINKMLNNKD